MELIKTKLQEHQANLYVRSACKPEWAYRLITDLSTAKEDVEICAALFNSGLGFTQVGFILKHLNDLRNTDYKIDYDTLNSRIKDNEESSNWIDDDA